MTPIYKKLLSGPRGTTWSQSDKHWTWGLTDRNLTASVGVTGIADVNIRATASARSGKKYFEARPMFTNARFGFGNSTEVLQGFFGGSLNGLCWVESSGQLYRNSAVLATINTYAVNDIIAIAIDIDAELFWGKNITAAGNWNNDGVTPADPAAGTGGVDFSSMNAGPWFPMMTAYSSIARGGGTANFGGTPYAATPPNGFSNW